MAEERKTARQKRYATLSRETVQMFAESAGHSDLPEDVVNLLSEDVMYRLREVTQNSTMYMTHARRKRMTAEDFNKALRNSDVQPVFGHGSHESPSFRQTREGELSFVEDLDKHLCDIAASSHTPHDIGKVTVKAQWLAVEGVQKAPPLGPQDITNGKVPRGVSEELLLYYDNITKAILGNDEELMKLAFADLRTNGKIAPLLPFFVNFVSNGVKTVNHDIGQLTRLLHTVRALISNQSLYLEPKPYLNLLVQGVLYCVIEPLAASINPLNDHWALRDYAARLLAQITRAWDSPLNHLGEQNLQALQQVLYNLARPFCSHYGAVMGLIAFGAQAVEDILLPHLPNYWPHLLNVLEDTSFANAQVKADAHKVHGAMLLAAEYVLIGRGQILNTKWEATSQEDRKDMPTTRRRRKTSSANPSTSTPIKSDKGPDFVDGDLIGPVIQLPEMANPFKIIADLYGELYNYFGDSLSVKLPLYHLKNVRTVAKKETCISLGDANSKKSGEELLQELLDSSPVEVRPVAVEHEVEDIEMKSENQSFEPTFEDLEFDEKSEPSSRSELSSRSSRSDRSHSDENLSFLGDDTDLTVKATVSDPSLGIKLTITKRPKIKTVFQMHGDQDFGSTSEPRKLITDPKTKKKKELKLRDVFERTPIGDKAQDCRFVFRFQGREQKCSTHGRRMKHSVACSSSDTSLGVENKCRNLSLRMKAYGKKERTARYKLRRSMSAMSFYMSDMKNSF